VVAKIKRPPTPLPVKTAMAREEMARMVIKPDLPMAYAAALMRCRELANGMSDHDKARAHGLAGVILTPTRRRRR